MSKLLEVKDLMMYIQVKRGVVKVVDRISFSVGAGKAFGIVGESGCGKTMTSLSLLKLQPDPAGQIIGSQIILDGEDLVTKSEAEMRKVQGRKLSILCNWITKELIILGN